MGMLGSSSGAILLLIAVPAAAPAQSHDSATFKAEFEARYATLKYAIDRHDTTALGPMLAKDFVSVDVSGNSTNSDAMLHQLAVSHPSRTTISTTAIDTIRRSGKTATIVQTYDGRTLISSRGGQQYVMRIVAHSVDIWVQDRGTWLLKSTTTEDLTSYGEDGQILSHTTRAGAR